MLDRNSLWQEVIFDPEPFSKEPAVGPDGRVDVKEALGRLGKWYIDSD
ncbi:MAG: hypothetical protein QMD50_00625 [Patescibacteria group bacterium]|nr:hypothetical protein [Patescibacteria group bacterium]